MSTPILVPRKNMNILLLGGSGFIGTHVANRLTAAGHRLTVPTRRWAHARHLTVLPTCDIEETDIFNDAALDHLMAGQDAVVNLIGILHGSQAAFTRTHVELPRRVVAAGVKHGAHRLLHMSALGAAADSPSIYQRTKAAGEAAVMSAPLEWTVFRPSVI
ncbi:MAG TPA: NAD(P)H-binding protein, partial [Burkholderiaceae bacterium]|nr:NAD(P)H-binding protein [Burkholderiaceae bacterium]